ncbi:hypothetical protein Tco_0836252, partial [Tanacetum coccineum]
MSELTSNACLFRFKVCLDCQPSQSYASQNLLKKTRSGQDESSSRGECGKKKTLTFVNALSSV